MPDCRINDFDLFNSEDIIVEKMDGGFFVHTLKPDLRRIYIEITSRCNLNCEICVRRNWSDQQGDMDLELLKVVLGQIPDFPQLKQIYIGGLGEPLFHPQIIEILDLLHLPDIRVKITTNGMLMHSHVAEAIVDSRINDIIVSCDSLESEEFARIRRGGNLTQVFDNIQYLNRIKEKRKTGWPRLHLEFVLMKQNRDQLERLADFAREVGAESVLVTNIIPYIPEMVDQILYDRSSPSLPPEFWGHPGLFASLCTVDYPRMAWGARRRCQFIERNSTVIGWDGQVSPCYALAHSYSYYIFGRKKNVSRYSVGDITRNRLLNIWLAEEYVKFRGHVRLFRFPSCEDCALKENCDYTADNEDCWGANPSCADCLWAQDIVRCP